MQDMKNFFEWKEKLKYVKRVDYIYRFIRPLWAPSYIFVAVSFRHPIIPFIRKRKIMLCRRVGGFIIPIERDSHDEWWRTIVSVRWNKKIKEALSDGRCSGIV